MHILVSYNYISSIRFSLLSRFPIILRNLERHEKKLEPAAIMAKRNHTTELGCIACEELTELGAGKEGWLIDNPNLLCALDTHALALASRSLVLTLSWSDSDSSRVQIRPDLSPIEAEVISAVEWLVFNDIRAIAVGTSCGYLLIYSLGGDLIHKQVNSLIRVEISFGFFF